ncbi:MFS transporter [Conexibacter sp. DBS9H8]|uniref:MFS transporter n=1 Tax=Conexibacter sp. DBS9H8 TaxID=2937801 RepID=UPI00200FEC07|nr:MFS transporter [Conexibacter sp. DBS9H8]
MSATATDLVDSLNEAPASRFHSKAIFVSGMGFFTDAYDLFIIGTASALIAKQWNLNTSQVSLINSMTLLGAFVGAIGYGRLADLVGRKRIYGLEALIMMVAAIACALSPSFIFLVVFRFILGLGVGGDYPVSAVLMTEYANRANRGKMVGLVFAMQALGTLTGYAAGLALLSSGVISPDWVWRLLLGFGAIPAAMVLYSRRRMPESPRYQLFVEGDESGAATSLAAFSDGQFAPPVVGRIKPLKLRLSEVLGDRRTLLLLLGTAGSWFVFDYAYYGNSVSAPLIVKTVLGAGATTQQSLALNLLIFSVAAVPGYYLAANYMDRIGHRRLQMVGFVLMGVMFLLIGVIPGVTTAIAPFLILFGASYFFAEFGPNTTTFVLAGEVYPTSARTTCHGISAGIAKLGAFIGVYLFPHLTKSFGVSGAMEFSAGMALIGLLLTTLLPEPAGQTLEQVSGEAAQLKLGSALAGAEASLA